MARIKKKKKKKGQQGGIGDESSSKTIRRDEEKAEKESLKYYSEGALGRIADPAPIASLGPAPQATMVSRDNPYGAASIADAERAYQAALTDDPYVKAALERAQSSLGGYSTEENQALRAQGKREVNRNSSTALRQLRLLQGQSGASGMNGAAVRVLKDAANAGAQVETDILAKNAEEQRLRLANFGTLANQSYINAAGVKDQALKNLMGIRNDVAAYGQEADKINAGIAGKNQDIQLSYDTTNADIASKNIENVKNAALTNLSQREKEIAGQAGIYYGSQGTSIARRQADKAERAAKRAERIASQRI